MFHYELFFNGASSSVKNGTKYTLDALVKLAEGLFSGLSNERFNVVALDEKKNRMVAFQSTESFDAFCVGKRSFAFEFITVEPIKHQVLRQLVRGDFNLRHVNPPIEKKTCVVANVQLPGELFREIVNKKVILRHVVTTVKRGKVCVQPARRDVEEAMWSRIRNGPSAIETLSVRRAIRDGNYRLKPVSKTETPVKPTRSSFLNELVAFSPESLNHATTRALSTRARVLMLQRTPRSQPESQRATLKGISQSSHALKPISAALDSHHQLLKEIVRSHNLKHVVTRELSPSQRVALLLKANRVQAINAEIVRSLPQLNHVRTRVSTGPVEIRPRECAWSCAIVEFDKNQLKSVQTCIRTAPVLASMTSDAKGLCREVVKFDKSKLKATSTRVSCMPIRTDKEEPVRNFDASAKVNAFADNLRRLAEMGFSDRTLNIHALLDTKNEIVAAVCHLLQQ